MSFYLVTEYRLCLRGLFYTSCPTLSWYFDKVPCACIRNYICIYMYIHTYLENYKKKNSPHFKVMYREQPWTIFKCIFVSIFTFTSNKRGPLDFKDIPQCLWKKSFKYSAPRFHFWYLLHACSLAPEISSQSALAQYAKGPQLFSSQDQVFLTLFRATYFPYYERFYISFQSITKAI